MPIYEYRCAECGHEFEQLQKISDAALVECPACGKPALQKLVSAAGFRLKGGGWYETDFKKDKKKNLAKADSARKDPGGGDSAKSGGKSGGDGKKSAGSGKTSA
ncbi:MAG: zinc ribbon domain-containing protein [Gammaproteobacteria bacterium]|jgi:putative FmdB family regulatory protein